PVRPEHDSLVVAASAAAATPCDRRQRRRSEPPRRRASKLHESHPPPHSRTALRAPPASLYDVVQQTRQGILELFGRQHLETRAPDVLEAHELHLPVAALLVRFGRERERRGREARRDRGRKPEAVEQIDDAASRLGSEAAA